MWQIKNREDSLDEDKLIEAIKSGLLQGEDILINSELSEEVAIKDSIYAYYLEDKNDQNQI